MMLRGVILALCAGAVSGMTQCNTFTDCTTCLNPDSDVECGWCVHCTSVH